ncbi:(3S,6E)-nerolidol synthase 1, chloroplastic [Vitis vinifera]|uniref:(3S,6E)-nerolidol synthase 1, chloroplastic n=1 Tax=Vitis vinifera TaxID=29760 RepID=A0A438HPI0_VITVI|nr:(3S,6E)-nerolidol synthase 1, chloroplastic [Vitis vinifera]
MACSCGFYAWSIPAVGSNQFREIGKTNFTRIVPMPNTHKWSIAHDHTLVSIPLKKDNHSPELGSFTDEFYNEHAQKLKEVKHVFSKLGEDAMESMMMIDAIQRLGIDHHFEEEIEAVLQKQYMKSSIHGDCDEDLYEVALRFRLLRQEGYTCPADVLNNFKNKEGKFKQNLREDIRGLMGLYEASQLSIGEDILEEAGNFSSLLLNACLQHLDRHQAAVVKNTLEHPHHKSLARFMTKNFLTDFQGTNGWINALQELANIDFNMVKSVHQKEMLQISKSMVEGPRFDRGVEVCKRPTTEMVHVANGNHPNPRLSEQRIELTKPISLIYIIDDIFDVGGTLDELTLFTEAVNRWDLSAFKELPEYMKMCFKTLDDITNEISTKVHKVTSNPVGSLRKAWASLCNAFLVEAKWFASGHVPKAEEYLKNGAVSIISSTATILRLWDDLGSAKDENQDGHDGSYVECYLKEHRGSSVENARQIVAHMISDMWKRLNKECLSPNPFSTSFTKGSLNIARMVPLMYSYDDQQCLPGLEEHMKSLLLENLPYRNAQKINE